MQALNLYIKDGVGINLGALVVFYPVSKVALVGLLDGDEFAKQVLILGLISEVGQLGEVSDPSIGASLLREQFC